MDKPKTLVEVYSELLEPYGIATSPLQEVLREAAERVGLLPPSAKPQQRQKSAANGRKIQREEDLADRRLLVASFFKELRAGLRDKPSSTGTAQAILGR